MRKIKIILNPNAGKNRRGGSRTALTKIIEALNEKNIAFEVVPTNFPGEAKILAKKASEDKTLGLLLVIGGDGTINEAINGLINSDLPLGIIPAGSLNCAAREMGISSNPKKAIYQLLDGDVKTIHLGKIAFNKNPPISPFGNPPFPPLPKGDIGGLKGDLQVKERYFLLMAGIGLDAKAVVDFNPRLKKIIGPLAYVWSGLKQIFTKNHPILKIESSPAPCVSTQVSEGKCHLEPTWGGASQKIINGYSCVINKLKTYAWFNFAPEAGIEKDFFQMFIYKKNDILSLIRYGIGGMFGWHRHVPSLDRSSKPGTWHRKFSDVESHLVKNVKITSNETVYIQADGEAAGILPVEISIIPNAIKILLPK
ncbi:MAG: diacylglycerol kinase family protein [bacterium]